MKNKGIFNDFIKYVSLNILGQAAFSCYTLADTFFVSANLGVNGITALNLAFPVFCLINGIGLMIGMGGDTRYSILKAGEMTKKRIGFLTLLSVWRLIPMAFLLSALLKMTGVWCAYPLTEFIVAWVGVIFYISSIERKEISG